VRLEEEAWRDLKAEGATAEELETASGRVREVYERAVAQVPPGGEKRHWRRYIFLWLNYALFEEIETKARFFTKPLNERSQRHRITLAQGRSIKRPSRSYLISNSHSPSSG